MTTRAIPQKRAKVRGPSIWQRIWESRLAYLYILPGIVVMGIITFFPLFYQIWMSMTDYGITNLKTANVFVQIAASLSPAMAEANPDLRAPNFIGLQNFVQVLTNDLALPGYDFWYMLSFNLIWTFI